MEKNYSLDQYVSFFCPKKILQNWNVSETYLNVSPASSSAKKQKIIWA